ncbi:MAG: mechanosensitive ion channel family protein, partial [Candidatus Saccharibacteria bacterium]
DPGLNFLSILIVGFLVYYVGEKLLARLVRQIVKGARHREWHRKDIEKRQKTLVHLFVTIWRMIVIFAVVYAIMREVSPNVTELLAPLFASAGIIGIALGFGAQSLIKDFLTGIFIITENQYRVGDIIDIDGFSGTVERIGTRSTVMRDVDGNVHYFPNGIIQHVVNKTMGYSMARFSITLHPSSDIEKVSDIIDEIGKKLSEEDKWKDKILEAPSFVSIGEFNGNSVELIIAGKTQPSDQWSVVAEMRRRLLEKFESQGIQLATQPFAPSPRQKK